MKRSRKNQKWKASEDVELLSLYNKGYKVGTIAKKLNRTKNAVYTRILNINKFSKKSTIKNKKVKSRVYYEVKEKNEKFKNKNKSWTEKEMDYLLDNIDEKNRNETLNNIAKHLGRTFTSVRVKYNKYKRSLKSNKKNKIKQKVEVEFEVIDECKVTKLDKQIEEYLLYILELRKGKYFSNDTTNKLTYSYLNVMLEIMEDECCYKVEE